MFEYTRGNHFKFGYNGLNRFQARESERDVFTAEYGVASIPGLNWRQANEAAARDIYSKKVGDVFILLSGGMDSEICLRSFLDQNLPVKTVTARYLDIDQSEEINHVERLVADHGLKHEYIDVRLLDFMKSKELFQTIDPIRCVSPIIGLQLWAADQTGGTPVIAQGEVHLKKEVPADYIPGESPYLPGPWHLFESERLCSIYMNFILRQKPAIPGFFQYMPEQILSFLTKNPHLKNLIENKVPGKLGTRTSKNIMSQQFYPEIPLRQKLHGWEAIQELHDQLRQELAERFPHSDASFKIEYQELIKKLSPGS